MIYKIKKVRYTCMKNVIIIFLFCSIAFIALSSINSVSAAPSIIYVNGSHGNDNWDGTSWATAKLSIKNATGAVSNGGTVKIANGVYTGTKNTEIIINKNIIITGQSKTSTIINGTNRAWIFQTGTKVTIQNLTLTNGNTTYGGAIVNNGNLILNNCNFRNNYATNGGVIYNAGNVTVSGSTFTSNRAAYGGAVYNKGNLTVSGSFTGNSATQGGGAVYNRGRLTVSGSTFTSNRATYGGSIYNTGDSTVKLSVKDSTFKYNNADQGGAILNHGGSLTFSKSTFTSNTATVDDGGAILNSGGPLTVTYGIFTGNTAYDGGGAIHNYGNLNVTNSSFTKNKAEHGSSIDDVVLGKLYTSIFTNCNFYNNSVIGHGGVIICNDTLTLTNCTFTNNSANYGGTAYNLGNLIFNNCTFTGNYAKTNGGTVYNKYSLTFNGNTCRNNHATYGGAVYNLGNLAINNSIFTGNYAKTNGGTVYNKGSLTFNGNTCKSNRAIYGGAIYTQGKSLIVKKSIFTGNTATGNGGVIYNGGNTITATGSTFTGNHAIYGGAIYNLIGTLTVHFNRFAGNTATVKDIYRAGGTVNAELNWWGSNSGPATGSIKGFTPTTWFVLRATASPRSIDNTTTSTITANLTYDNKGVYHDPISGRVPDGTPVSFATSLGSIKSQVSTVNGTAKSTLTSRTRGTAYVTVTVDSQKITISVKVQ